MTIILIILLVFTTTTDWVYSLYKFSQPNPKKETEVAVIWSTVKMVVLVMLAISGFFR